MSESPQPASPNRPDAEPARLEPVEKVVPESGGRGGQDPTRFGDWEKNGRCIDF